MEKASLSKGQTVGKRAEQVPISRGRTAGRAMEKGPILQEKTAGEDLERAQERRLWLRQIWAEIKSGRFFSVVFQTELVQVVVFGQIAERWMIYGEHSSADR